MRASACFLLVTAFITTTPVLAQQDALAPSIQTHMGHLKCGDARLTAATRYFDVPDHDRQVLTQTLELTIPDNGTTTTLAHDGHVFRQPFLKNTPVFDAAATGWACLQASDGKLYLYVVYTCVESNARPKCVGTLREWARIFDTAGHPLTANYPRSGRRTPALMKKLGLGRYLNEGVSLSGIDEPARAQ